MQNILLLIRNLTIPSSELRILNAGLSSNLHVSALVIIANTSAERHLSQLIERSATQ